MDTYDILVIILSITLIVFLLLAIIATVLCIKLLKKLDIARASAQQALQNVESMTSTLKNAAKGTAITSLLGSFWKKARSSSKARR